MSVYAVKEVFGAFQGEGAQAGSPCVFVRFAGCNVWDGKEESREEAARERGGCARFCDTDFIGTDGHNGGRYKGVNALVGVAEHEWNGFPRALQEARASVPQYVLRRPSKLVVFTGGEPTLQLTPELVDSFHNAGWRTAIETNGSNQVPSNVGWVTVSPKPPKRVVLATANEVKCLYPDVVPDPRVYEYLAPKRYVQPVDKATATELESLEAFHKCVRFALDTPGWKVSLQLHKLMGVT